MSIRSKLPIPAPATVDGTVPLTPEQIVEQLRILRRHIPDFGPLDVPDAAALRRTANLHDDMVQAATNTVGASEFVTGAVGKDAPAMRNERVDIGRWTAVEHELGAMSAGVAAGNLVRRYRLGLTSLQAYFIARQLVRQEAHAALLPHVKAMREAKKFGPKRRTRPADTPAVPAPVPAQK